MAKQPKPSPRMDPADKEHPAFQPMPKRRVHPNAIAQAEARAQDPPPFVPEQVTTDADAMEAKAREQYAEACRGYIPGFALSNLPANFVVRLKLNTEGRARAKERGKDSRTFSAEVVLSAWKLTKDVRRWENIREHLLDYPDPCAVPIVPKGWSYAALVGDAKPHRFDLKNPRLYTLEGRLVPWEIPNHRELARRYTGNPYGHFPSRLVDVFMEAAPNDREAEVVAFMEHHRTKGGNPEALANYVEGLLEKWTADPPKRTNIQRFVEGPQPIPEHGIFIRALEGWLAKAPKVPASAKEDEEGGAQTFAALLGDHLAAVSKAMKDAGIRYTKGRGKRRVVAALHAGCNRYGKPLPLPTLWPVMLRELFPGTTWSDKVKPIESTRELEKAKDYTDAYRAIMDRLQ